MHDGIVGGKVSVPHSRPYMVYICNKISKVACGVFLVREDYVITAAHYGGGPLVCGGVAEGILSFSKNKENADHFIGYTHISHYIPWIQTKKLIKEAREEQKAGVKVQIIIIKKK
uniref:Peptidase S1 domain-containing protein n=1 Tax=Sinocyclocheilus grahami TaxID=75366 RepID=A0A672P1U0_SINGR